MPTMKRLAGDQLVAAGRVDRRRVRATTDAQIARQIAADPDTAPEMPADAAARVVRRPAIPDVRQVRAHFGLSRAAFAARFRLRTHTVQAWEQGRAVPDQPARVLLAVILNAPEAVARAVRES